MVECKRPLYAAELDIDSTGSEMKNGGQQVKTATASTAKIYIDGKEAPLTAYTIDGNNYFKLRDVMKAFDVFVGWDGVKNTISLDTSKSY